MSINLQEGLYSKCVEVPVKCFEGHLYVRISAFVYNELRDYQVLAQAVGALLVSCAGMPGAGPLL